MNTYAKNKRRFWGRCVHFLGIPIYLGLMVALIVPAIALSQSSPAPVNLGTAADFAVLAKTGISTTGVTSITNDIGVSPTAATYITGFGLIMDASGTFSTSSLVVGNIYAADYTDPTPTKMTAAVSDMETAYTDAAGRTLPDYTERYAGDITGQTLTRGLYNWSTGVLVSGAGVTISGTPSDVWIFQIAQNLELSSGAAVTLIGGAQASNIFWQVAGQVSLGTTAAMKGIILCQTSIVMSTGATLNGRALAQTAVTLDANAVTSAIATAVNTGENAVSPQEFALLQNYPNPFNPATTINFQLPISSNVKLSIFNMEGRTAATLVNKVQSAGSYQIEWNAGNLPSGVYYCQLIAGSFVSIKKMVLIK